MLDLHCSGCRRRVLVGTRAIEGWSEDSAGIRLEVRCPCGALNLVRTGRGRDPEPGDPGAPIRRPAAPPPPERAARAA